MATEAAAGFIRLLCRERAARSTVALKGTKAR
jgi:hypothetical protein